MEFCLDHAGTPNAQLCRDYALQMPELWAGKARLHERRQYYLASVVPFTTASMLAIPVLKSAWGAFSWVLVLLPFSHMMCAGRRIQSEFLMRDSSDDRAVIFTAAQDKWRRAKEQRRLERGGLQLVPALANG